MTYRRWDGTGRMLGHERKRAVYRALEYNGWTVLKNGWPDCCAFRPGKDGGVEVRFIKVRDHFAPRQQRMVEALRQVGITVQLVHSYGDIEAEQ